LQTTTATAAIVASSQQQHHQPSTQLRDKIKSCASAFRSLSVVVNEVIELGKNEGFSPKDIGNFIREEMLKSGLSRSTASRYLPSELKMKPRGRQISRNLTLNQHQHQQEPKIIRNKPSATTIEFSGKISNIGSRCKGVYIPKKYHNELNRCEGKEIKVTITVL
jgi:hypothetical protein